MVAYNVVRFRVKPGHEKEFEDIHRKMDLPAGIGFRGGAVVKTGDRTYCFIGEWDSMQKLAGARAPMIKNLDAIRGLLEDLGDGLGVTDPVSGEAVVELTARP